MPHFVVFSWVLQMQQPYVFTTPKKTPNLKKMLLLFGCCSTSWYLVLPNLL